MLHLKRLKNLDLQLLKEVLFFFSILILNTLFLASCSSAPENYFEQKYPTILHKFKDHIIEKCVTTKTTGGFSGYIKFANTQLLQVNSIFKNNYSAFELEVISPLGEPFASFRLNNKKLQVSENALTNEQMETLALASEETGGLFIRELLCGVPLFPSRTEKVYTTTINSPTLDVSTKSDSFYSQTEYKGSKRNYYFHNQILVSSNNVESNVIVNSTVYSGFFRNFVGTLSWKATLTPQQIIPHEFRFTRNLFDVLISFSDFD